MATMSRWATEIASALAFVHEKHIIHRDIKSLNVLMFRRQQDGTPVPPKPYQPVPPKFTPAPPQLLMCKLCDFGIATMSDSGFASNDIEPTRGTVAWMAPEVRALCDAKSIVDRNLLSPIVLLYQISTVLLDCA